MLTLIVKGKPRTAILHAKKNGLPDCKVNNLVADGTETILTTEETNENLMSAGNWFTNQDYGYQAPYKKGSLLFFKFS
jgi:hypothetical protein